MGIYIISYVICGIILLIYLLNVEINKSGFYSITIIDFFIAWTIISLWPFISLMMSFQNKIDFNKERFKIGKKD